MSRNRWTELLKRAKWCAVVGLGLAGTPTGADAGDRPTSSNAADDESARNLQAVPYSVRMRITGYLARQHARDGDNPRALREYHSMLSVDDPAWPDNEEGDEMRIGRDMEVARMMAESGFYDHAIRVLDVAKILAQTNDDPQESVLDRQMEATAQLAQLKGARMPEMKPTELSFSTSRPMAQPATIDESDAREMATESTAPQLTEPARIQPPVARATRPAHSSLPELPPPDARPAYRETYVPQVQIEQKPENNSLLSRLVPSRWRDNEEARLVPRAMPQPAVVQQRPMMSPNLPPTYCSECASHAVHHHVPVQSMQAERLPQRSRESSRMLAAAPVQIYQTEPAAAESVPAGAPVQTTSANEQSVAKPARIAATNTAAVTPKPATTQSAATDPATPKRGVLNKLAARRAAAKAQEDSKNGLKPPVVKESAELEAKSKPAAMPTQQVDSNAAMKLTGLEGNVAKGSIESEVAATTGSMTEDEVVAAEDASADAAKQRAVKDASVNEESVTDESVKDDAIKHESSAGSTVNGLTPAEATASKAEPASETEMDEKFEMTEVEPAKDEPAKNESVAEKTQGDAVPTPATSGVRSQVGLAGQVSNPGIFAVEGNSTTLAALLRRAGNTSPETIKRTRVLRTVDLGKSADSDGQQKDFWLQRFDAGETDAKALATPIYGQELVIVDGDGPKPVYIAVMPHFILQIPVVDGRPTTAQQIVEQLRVHWPNIRNHQIGVLRYADWGRAVKVAPLEDDEASLNTPLASGDVLYVDGVTLDQPHVIAAAEAVARLVGAKIRKAQ